MYYRELDEAWRELLAPGGPFELTETEVRGERLRTFKNAPASVRDFWLSSARHAERPYLIYRDEQLTYAEAHRQTGAIAAWLTNHGVRHGDYIGLAMRNYPEWLLIYWASLAIGAVVVAYNAWWTAEEFTQGLAICPPKVLFCDSERLPRIGANTAPIVTIRCAAPGAANWSDVISGRGAMPDAHIDGDDDACIFFTSGTSGKPKGARLTHRGCITSLYSVLFAARAQGLAIARANGAAPDPPAAPAALVATPFFHVSACNSSAYAATHGGGKLVLMHHWDAEEALRLIEAEKITSVRGVPTMTRELMLHPRLDAYDTRSLLSVGGGGAPMAGDLVTSIPARTARARPTTAYGLTETHGVVSAIGSAFFLDKPESVGRATPTYDVKLADESGAPAPKGAIGELCLRGPGVIKGYIGDPEATNAAIIDGWLHTGDLARIDDDGFIFIVDRKKDMLIRGGENVYCAEVEACLYRLSAIRECCVLGMPDERLGEVVGAAIVLQAPVRADDIRAHCARYLAKHKIPQFIWILSEGLPRNAAGKFLRRQLRDTLKTSDAS